MSRPDSDKPALPSLPITAWPSLLSLDAVFVALAWQQLLLVSFCQRSASWSEMSALAAAVWLIYVADRLLDAGRLQLDQPHTLRHRFYHRHARPFLLIWFAVLICTTITVVRYLPSELLRGGLLLACAVLVYGVHLHLGSRIVSTGRPTPEGASTKYFIPKEIRVGTLFALGVTLTTWTQLTANTALAASAPAASGWLPLMITGPWGTLLATTCALALLFSSNCMLVARFEYQLDHAQAFASIATQRDQWPATCWTKPVEAQPANIAVSSLPLLLLMIQLPGAIFTAVIVSAIGLGFSLALPSRPQNLFPLAHASTAFDIRSVWVDAALWTPPVVLSLL